MTGEYPPGSRIVETRVARAFGTSQAPVREALRDLESLGVVELTPFRGARVRRPTRNELLEAYGIRAELEALGARLALARMSDQDLAELGRYVDEMQEAARARDPHAEALADARFHGRVIKIAGNRTIERVWRTLEPFSRTYITLVVPGADRKRIADLHPPVLKALRRHDADAAAAALRRHFSEASAMLGRLWADEGDPRNGSIRAGPAPIPSSEAASGVTASGGAAEPASGPSPAAATPEP